jgi:hypothetical protein
MRPRNSQLISELFFGAAFMMGNFSDSMDKKELFQSCGACEVLTVVALPRWADSNEETRELKSAY